MENVKTKRSNLVMPTHYQELTREEMEYVDGGAYLSSETVNSIMFAVTAATFSLGFVAITKRNIGKIFAKGFASLFAVSRVAAVAVAALTIIIGIYAYDFFEGLYIAQQKGTGIDISVGFFRLKKSYY